RILAKAINCLAPVAGEPCNVCTACESINRGAAFDLVEMDAASNRGIDDVRDLREKINFAPTDLSKKVYLLDEAHMLTTPAFNALLKTLEEPPPHAYFILATTDFQAMPKTIVSRCQRFDFHRGANEAIVGRLTYIAEQEGFSVPPDGLRAIAAQSRGGFRDAITLLEQVVAQCGPSPSTDAVEEALGIFHDARSDRLAAAILEKDLAEALAIAWEVADDGVDIGRFAKDTINVFREKVHDAVNPAAGQERARPQDLAIYLRAMDVLAAADFKRDPGSPVPLEVAVATAILGPAANAAAPVESGAIPGAAAAVPAARAGSGQPPRTPQARAAAQADVDAALTTEERFIRRLYESTRLTNTKVAACLNGSCEVLAIEDEAVELGFYFAFHMQQVENEGRAVVEAEASKILERPVTLRMKLVERPATPRKAARGGHLAEAARSLGATPVGKER
ncbi:MAG TPA: DNA polymerase III subunit gamma/tau, partial [Tepidiformaceae bacterium]|nr:DNA polymerase III subunit gamma/tau [Tepidiformaceae bacterium]